MERRPYFVFGDLLSCTVTGAAVAMAVTRVVSPTWNPWLAMAVGMVRQFLSIIGLKDTMVARNEQDDHGYAAWSWVPAGQGVVDWAGVFAQLKDTRFDGPLSVHGEIHVEPDEFIPTIKHDVAFFRKYMNA